MKWAWKKDHVVAVNIIREKDYGTGEYVNRGAMYIKFRTHKYMKIWKDEFEGCTLGGSTRLSVVKSRSDIVCYHPKMSGPMQMRAMNRIWDIIEPGGSDEKKSEDGVSRP